MTFNDILDTVEGCYKPVLVMEWWIQGHHRLETDLFYDPNRDNDFDILRIYNGSSPYEMVCSLSEKGFCQYLAAYPENEVWITGFDRKKGVFDGQIRGKSYFPDGVKEGGN